MPEQSNSVSPGAARGAQWLVQCCALREGMRCAVLEKTHGPGRTKFTKRE